MKFMRNKYELDTEQLYVDTGDDEFFYLRLNMDGLLEYMYEGGTWNRIDISDFSEIRPVGDGLVQQWEPKKGQVVKVRDQVGDEWSYRVYVEGNGGFRCENGYTGDPDVVWKFCDPLTDKEIGI